MGAFVAFCLLSAATTFLFSVLMSRQSLAAFTIPAVEQHWDLQQKAAACRNAGFMYLFLAVVVTAQSMMTKPVSREERIDSYDRFFDRKEAAPLLLGKDEDDEDGAAPARRSGVPVNRVSRAGGLYGSVEMERVPN